MKQPLHVKTRIISKLFLILGLVFVLQSAITQVRGQGVVTIHSTGDVTRGQTGSFVLRMNGSVWGYLVNFSVSGTAIPGVDYVPLVSPAQVVGGYGVISVATLPDPRASFFPQAYSVVVTLEPGFGYAIGEPSSAKIMINP